MSLKFCALAVLALSSQLSSGFVTPNGVKQPSLASSSQNSAFCLPQKQFSVAAGSTKSQGVEKTTNDDSLSKGLGRDSDVIFSIIDTDGSGSISREELTSHLSQAGYSEDVINKIFAKLDKNKDGSISEAEFRTGFALLPGLHSAPGLGNYNSAFVKEIHEDADQVFRSADEDGNGSIDEVELKSHMGRMFGKFSETAITKIFRLLDVDGDKTISREELRDAFVRYSALRQALGEGPNYK